MWNANKHLKSLIVPLDATIETAMRTIDANAAGLVLLLTGDGVLEGLVTDGDLRRAVLAGAHLGDPCIRYANRKFIAGRSDASRNANLGLMSRRIMHLPILDQDGRLVDVISWKDLWPINLVSPSFSGNELKYVEDCILTGWVSSQGRYVREFEESVAAFIGVRHAVSTSNCTAALQLAIQALDIGAGDEVIVPDFTFAASANAVLQRGGRPVFVDVDAKTWTLDPARIEAAVSPRTKAIMPVHIFGHPCDMEPIAAVAKRHRLKLIEDCAEAFGAHIGGRKMGAFGDVGCFSFFANKIITTGEGGMITTNDDALAARLRLLRDHGMSPERRYWHLEAGTNCRLTNLQAAIGLAQMERVSQFVEHRDRLAERYDEELAGIPGIVPHQAASWARKVCWLYSITVDAGEFGMSRDALMAELEKRGIETRPLFLPLHIQPAYPGSQGGSFPVSQFLGANGMSLPTGNDTPLIEVARVAEAIRELARRHPKAGRPRSSGKHSADRVA